MDMVGILIISHYGLGESLAECAAHIMSRPIPQLRHLAVSRQDDPDVVFARAKSIVDDMNQGDGVLVLTDMFGGTPSNVANRLIIPGLIEAVAGVNLPMVVRALCYSHEPLETVVAKAITGGLEGVLYVLPEQPAKEN